MSCCKCKSGALKYQMECHQQGDNLELIAINAVILFNFRYFCNYMSFCLFERNCALIVWSSSGHVSVPHAFWFTTQAKYWHRFATFFKTEDDARPEMHHLCLNDLLIYFSGIMAINQMLTTQSNISRTKTGLLQELSCGRLLDLW